jgi:hypothetical protein
MSGCTKRQAWLNISRGSHSLFVFTLLVFLKVKLWPIVLPTVSHYRTVCRVRYGADFGLDPDIAPLPGWARKRHRHRSKMSRYSITLSARASSMGGTVRPSALAVLRLRTSSNLVGCSTGKSAGLAPFNILSTNVAARRNKSEISVP